MHWVMGGSSDIMRHSQTGARTVLRERPLAPAARRSRLLLLGVLALAWVGLLVYRLASMQIVDVRRWAEWAARQHSTEIRLASERGPIFDRNRRLLAVSVPSGSIYARPRQIKDKYAAAKQLSAVLDRPVSALVESLDSQSPFIWIERQVPRALADQVGALKIPGVNFVIEPKRYYPLSAAGSSLVGKVGIDGIGLSGLEMRYEQRLHGSHFETVAAHDALGKVIERSTSAGESDRLPRGDSLTLTVDAGLQIILNDELERGRVEAKAQHTLGVLIDAESGEILALGQAPSVNFNLERLDSRKELRNLVLETVFEPGSIMKPVVAAAALEEQVVTPDEVLDCGNGRLQVGTKTIRDVHPYAALSFFNVLVRSSNIGMSRIGARLGKERLYGYLRKFGFGQSCGIELPGSTDGLLRPPSKWALIDEATHAFGHGMAVTPLQMVRAISAIANDGVLPQPRLVLGLDHPQGVRVISAESAAKVREMMYAVVEDSSGTGHKAAIEGVRVAGKTGTAQKPRANGRGYADGKFVSSFVGFVDGHLLGVPKVLTMIVVVDEPGGEAHFGGAVAAPIFERAMRRSLATLNTTYNVQAPRDTIDPSIDFYRDGARALPIAAEAPRSETVRKSANS